MFKMYFWTIFLLKAWYHESPSSRHLFSSCYILNGATCQKPAMHIHTILMLRRTLLLGRCREEHLFRKVLYAYIMEIDGLYESFIFITSVLFSFTSLLPSSRFTKGGRWKTRFAFYVVDFVYIHYLRHMMWSLFHVYYTLNIFTSRLYCLHINFTLYVKCGQKVKKLDHSDTSTKIKPLSP